MRQLALLVLVVSSPAFAAVHIAQKDNPHDRGFERLPDLRLVRGAHPKDIPLVVTADIGEAWTIDVSYQDAIAPQYIALSAETGTGPATVTLHFEANAL